MPFTIVRHASRTPNIGKHNNFVSKRSKTRARPNLHGRTLLPKYFLPYRILRLHRIASGHIQHIIM